LRSAALAAGMELWREKLEEKLTEAFGANVGLEDSKRGTRGQLVGGTVEGQVAENSQRGPHRLHPNVNPRNP